MERVAAYIRGSTDRQDCEAQIHEIGCFLSHKKYPICSYYIDRGYSGRKANRPELTRLLEDIKSGAVTTVIAYKLDRVFRSLRNLLEVVNLCVTHKVNFIAIKDNFDMDTPAGRLTLHILGAVAEFECEVTRERVRSGLKRAKEVGTRNGRPIGRPRKTSYSSVIELRRKGHSYRQIAACLAIPIGRVQRACEGVKHELVAVSQRASE